MDKIEGTPFAIVEVEKGCFIALGNTRITEYMSYDTALHAINNKTWEVLFGVIQSLVTIMMREPEYRNIITEKLEKGGITTTDQS